MKKIVSACLILSLILGLCACGAKTPAATEPAFAVPELPNKLEVKDVTEFPVATQDMSKTQLRQLILDFFKDLEILAPEWAARLDNPQGAPWTREYLTLARYFVDRYWLQAVADYDLVSRVKLAVISCLTIRMLGGNLEETAQRYSKEIENDVDNIDAILDGAYESPAFTDDKLLGLLLK